MAFKSLTGGKHQPIDDNPTWLEIYGRLANAIGPNIAQSWFSHCRFVRLQSDSIELSHWCRFSARESTRQYGAELCKAANVSSMRMNHSDGFKPVCVEQDVAERRGFEHFTLARKELVKRETPPEAA